MKTKATAKPDKPYRDFPLFPHASGQWAKKVRGKTQYFGKWADWQGALEEYKRQRDYLQVGQEPPAKTPTVADVLNAFLSAKEAALDRHEITARSYKEYEAVCDIIATMGKTLPVELIDLEKLRNKLARSKTKSSKLLSPVSQKRFIGIARMVFNYANEEMELPKRVRYKKALRQPPLKSLRKARNKVGERLFTAEELRLLIESAKPQLKAMIYLGINCGFGNRDCATLPIEKVNIAGGWHKYHRPKTEVERRCPLWPETTAALYAVIKNRKSGPVFITKYGNTWEGKDRSCPISYEFRKLVNELEMHRTGITTFYSLRRTFETIGATSGEQLAVDFIMGHAPDTNDMAAVYRQKTFNTSLVKVTDRVHDWLNGSISLT